MTITLPHQVTLYYDHFHVIYEYAGKDMVSHSGFHTCRIITFVISARGDDDNRGIRLIKYQAITLIPLISIV